VDLVAVVVAAADSAADRAEPTHHVASFYGAGSLPRRLRFRVL
jgi:hypothetical protein